MKKLEILSGKELAKYFNTLDFENDFSEFDRVEKEMKSRYEDWYIIQLISRNK